MTTKRRGQITSMLRQRAVRALQTGTMRPGDRLPSTRQIAVELDVDPRVVLSAYRELAAEGLVELRERSGVYVAPQSPASASDPGMAESWVVDIFAQAIAREVSPDALVDWLQRSLGSRRLRATVVAGSADQLLGLCRELEADYGFDADGFFASTLDDGAAAPAMLEGADLLVTTEAHAAAVRQIGTRSRTPVIVVDVRPDLIGREWLDLLRQPVYVVVTDVSFIVLLRNFFHDTPGAANLRPVLLGRDSLSSIPPGATTYITQSARERLADTPIPGRVVPPARVFGPDTARELLTFVVRKNWETIRNNPTPVAPADVDEGTDLV